MGGGRWSVRVWTVWGLNHQNFFKKMDFIHHISTVLSNILFFALLSVYFPFLLSKPKSGQFHFFNQLYICCPIDKSPDYGLITPEEQKNVKKSRTFCLSVIWQPRLFMVIFARFVVSFYNTNFAPPLLAFYRVVVKKSCKTRNFRIFRISKNILYNIFKMSSPRFLTTIQHRPPLLAICRCWGL